MKTKTTKGGHLSIKRPKDRPQAALCFTCGFPLTETDVLFNNENCVPCCAKAAREAVKKAKQERKKQ